MIALRLMPVAAALALAAPAQATTLEDAIAAALAHAPDIAAAEAQADAARARVDQARGGGLPTVAISGTIGYGRLDPRNFFGLGAADVAPRAVQAAVEQPLFTGGRVSAGVAAARAGVEAAQAGRAMARHGVVLDTVQAYGDILATADMLRSYQALVAQTAEIERHARLRFRAGEAPDSDVAQAAALAAEARAGLAGAEAMRDIAQARYRRLTGAEPAAIEGLPANPPLPASLEDARALAVENNPALRQAEAELASVRAQAVGTRAEGLPMVSAFAEAASMRDQFFPDYRADSATVGIRGRWELFSGGRVSGRIHEADARTRAAEARLRDQRLRLDEQLLSAWRHARAAIAVERAADDRQQAAARALDSVRHEVRVGLKPQVDLLDAQRAHVAAVAGAAGARTARLVAAWRLKLLTGD